MHVLHPITVGTQNVGGMRAEMNIGHGIKRTLLRKVVHRQMDFLVLTEVKAKHSKAEKATIRYGLTPTAISLHAEPHAGVIVFSNPAHQVIEGSHRESATAGHIAAAVYNVRGTRTVVAGVYGESASNDRTSTTIIRELDDIITELQHVFHTQAVILAGDFNTILRPGDSNNPNHNNKPRTTAALQQLIDNHHLTDLASAANKAWHTWFRQSNQGQSSRIDLIFTNLTYDNLKFKSLFHFLDHSYLEATFGPVPTKKKHAMKDFILGSDEYLIRAHDLIQEHVNSYPTKEQDEENEPEEEEEIRHSETPNMTSTDDTNKDFNNTSTGHTAMHAFDQLITSLHKLHDQIARDKAKTQAMKLLGPSKEITQLKAALRRARRANTKEIIHNKIRALQKEIQDDMEAKEQASRMRIGNFYKSNTGKMVPETFQCIKDPKRNRSIQKLQVEGRETTAPEEIVQIMQEWYERTAETAQEQLVTLEQFIRDRNVALPQLSPEECEELEEEFTAEEVEAAIKEAKVASAPGPSGQTIAFFKLIFMHAPQLMTQALNQLVFVPHLATDPQLRWIQERKVVYIPKKAHPITPSDFRPLSMLEVLYKIPSRILARRLTKILPTLIGPHQHGFMPKKGIQEPSLMATHLIEEANRKTKPLQLVSFDIEKAFDNVGHKVIVQALRAFGVPEIMVQALRQYTLVGFARVEVNGRQGILITIKTGSGQGDPLSSILFLLATEPLNRALAEKHLDVMYTTDEGITIGPSMFADDNLLNMALQSAQDISPVINTYNDYQLVSGLKINIKKTAALCINTAPDVEEGLRQLGIDTPDHIKHLGIHLGKNITSTLTETMAQINPKAIKRRILATTPPTDILHRSTLIKAAFTPIYNHVFMAIPVQEDQCESLHKEVVKFLWTVQREGEEVQKRIRVSRKRIGADFAMGGLMIPHPKEIVTGFQQNLIQRIFQKNTLGIPSQLPLLLDTLLARVNRPPLHCHVQQLGPVQWQLTSNKLKEENTMFSQAFLSISTLLAEYEADKSSWHCAAINGHSQLGSQLFRINPTEAEALVANNILTVGQLFSETDTGGISRVINTPLVDRLADTAGPWLRTKLISLVNNINQQQLPERDKFAVAETTGSLLLKGDKHLSQLHRLNVANKLSQQIGTAPSYQTRVRDGVYHPDRQTFTDAYKVLNLAIIPSKTKEVAFEILNRTVWTNNKAFKSHLVDSPDCQLCGQTENMEHLLHNCPHYSEKVWAEASEALTAGLRQLTGADVAQLHFTPREIIFNSIHPSIQLHVQDSKTQQALILLVQEIKRNIIYRRMNPSTSTRNGAVEMLRIRAHLLSTIKKTLSFLEYQGIRGNLAAQTMLRSMIQHVEEKIT